MPLRVFAVALLVVVSPAILRAWEIGIVAPVDAQPLGANVERVLQAYQFLGRAVPNEVSNAARAAIARGDAEAIQRAVDQEVLFAIHINPESRVKVIRGPAKAKIWQSGYTPVLVKIENQAQLTERLRISSPQAGAVYGGAEPVTLERQAQKELLEDTVKEESPGRIFDVEMHTAPPMTSRLSGLECEYAIALVYCTQAGKREATIGFDVGQGTQDLGFRGETAVLFDVQPATPVKLSIRDFDGTPTTARLTFRDAQGNIHPPQAKRLAPDFFFQPQIYRANGETVLLSPGVYEVTSCRGPEYVEETRKIKVPESQPSVLAIQLSRWINPMERGYFCGDHHIHGAGCSHYTCPTEGVTPRDMFHQVKGEGLNVGCVLTWGPCFDHQRNYFSPQADAVSEPRTILKYDLEISGFGSAALGHVCLLNLTDQTYPGSEGTKTKGWPTWTVPVLRWAKEQGGVTGYPHSDMRVDPPGYAAWFLEKFDLDKDGAVDEDEARDALMAAPFAQIDKDKDHALSRAELIDCADVFGDKLPNLVLPAMTGAGALEIFVSTAEGVCDFISAMDTGRIGEWNTWYHIMNSGFPLKLSGETDFPCMSSRRVGQGRVYVKMSGEDGKKIHSLDFAEWQQNLAAGRSYVSDGFAHAMDFNVNGEESGDGFVLLDKPGTVNVRAKVAFAPRVPKAVAHGTQKSPDGERFSGDTVILHGERSEEWVEGGERLVEIVQNGKVVAKQNVPADGKEHDVSFEIDIDKSSWIALRQFPQLHTNPVSVIVDDKPIRASRESALWCAAAIDLCWKNRNQWISDAEKPAARASYDRAIAEYYKRAGEAE